MEPEKEINLLGFARRDLTYAATDRFYLAVTPKLFEWLQWAITLAILTYAQRKTHSVIVAIALGIAYGLAFAYFNSYFHQFRFTGVPLVKGARASRVVSVLLAGVLGLFTWYLVSATVKGIIAVQP